MMQKPSNLVTNSDQTQLPILADVWFLAAAPVEEKNTLESGMTFGEKRKGRTRKKIRVSLSDVLSGLGRTEIKFKGLDFQAYVDSLSSSAAGAMGNRVQYTRFIH